MPIRFIEVRRRISRWEIITIRSLVGFENIVRRKTKTASGVPNMTTVRRTGGMGSAGGYYRRVRIGGTQISDFAAESIAAAHLVEALLTLDRVHAV